MTEDDFLYWGNTSLMTLTRAKLNFKKDVLYITDQISLIANRKVHGIHVDHVNQIVYWLDWRLDVMEKLDLNTLQTNCISKIQGSYGICANVKNNIMYLCSGDVSKLFSSTLDGNNMKTILSFRDVRSVTLNPEGNILYLCGMEGLASFNLETKKQKILVYPSQNYSELVDLCYVI